MLRITVHDHPECMTFQLEGALVGPWVREAKDCWQGTAVRRHGTAIRFDLAGLTSIDAAGKAFLSAMHAEGAEFVAHGCLMRAIVAEIKGAPMRGCGSSVSFQPSVSAGMKVRRS